MPAAPAPTLEDAIQAALATVDDPEIRRPITDLGMVKGFTVTGPRITVELLLTVAGCPLRDKLTNDITAALMSLVSLSRSGQPATVSSSSTVIRGPVTVKPLTMPRSVIGRRISGSSTVARAA